MADSKITVNRVKQLQTQYSIKASSPKKQDTLDETLKSLQGAGVKDRIASIEGSIKSQPSSPMVKSASMKKIDTKGPGKKTAKKPASPDPDDDEGGVQVECPDCKRKFKPSSFQKHAKVCAKVFTQKTKEKSSPAKKESNNAGGDKGKWKEQSEAFRDALKQAKDTGAAADTPIIVAAPEAKKTKAKGKK